MNDDLKAWGEKFYARRVVALAEALAAAEASDQRRVDDLHRALYPDGGTCEGWEAEIAQVAALRKARPLA